MLGEWANWDEQFGSISDVDDCGWEGEGYAVVLGVECTALVLYVLLNG